MEWFAPYVGLPFEDGGRGPVAFDCWGLVRAVYVRELGVVLPVYGEISAHDLIRIAHAMDRDCDHGWREVRSPAPFDVALMRATSGGRAMVHVGVMVDDRRLLHIERHTAAVVVPVTHFSVAGRIAGYRRRV